MLSVHTSSHSHPHSHTSSHTHMLTHMLTLTYLLTHAHLCTHTHEGVFPAAPTPGGFVLKLLTQRRAGGAERGAHPNGESRMAGAPLVLAPPGRWGHCRPRRSWTEACGLRGMWLRELEGGKSRPPSCLDVGPCHKQPGPILTSPASLFVCNLSCRLGRAHRVRAPRQEPRWAPSQLSEAGTPLRWRANGDSGPGGLVAIALLGPAPPPGSQALPAPSCARRPPRTPVPGDARGSPSPSSAHTPQPSPAQRGRGLPVIRTHGPHAPQTARPRLTPAQEKEGPLPPPPRATSRISAKNNAGRQGHPGW
nr:collagen alpha-1(I) chain-like [Equus caballus]